MKIPQPFIEKTPNDLVDFLHTQYWCPLKPTNIEYVTSKKLNEILDMVIEEVEKGDWKTRKDVVYRLRSKRHYVNCENTEDEIQVATFLNSIIHNIVIELEDL